jgi:ABC-type nickel/cobalt efflux system permease component RcnA
VAIALVVVVLSLLQLPAQPAASEQLLAGEGGYLLVGALGLLLCWRA